MKMKFKPERISLELIVTIVLVILKLKGVIDWSWWYVTALLWMEAAVILVTLIGLGVILLGASKFKRK